MGITWTRKTMFSVHVETSSQVQRLVKCSGRYDLELFLQTRLSSNKLTVIHGIAHCYLVFGAIWNVRKGYPSQNNRTWTWKGDINGRRSQGACWTIYSLSILTLSSGVHEINTEYEYRRAPRGDEPNYARHAASKYYKGRSHQHTGPLAYFNRRNPA